MERGWHTVVKQCVDTQTPPTILIYEATNQPVNFKRDGLAFTLDDVEILSTLIYTQQMDGDNFAYGGMTQD